MDEIPLNSRMVSVFKSYPPLDTRSLNIIKSDFNTERYILLSRHRYLLFSEIFITKLGSVWNAFPSI